MNRTRVLRVLTHWRTWWDVASVVFVVWLSVVLAGVPTPAFLDRVFPYGLPLSIGCFFVGFGLLVRRQRSDGQPSNAEQ